MQARASQQCTKRKRESSHRSILDRIGPVSLPVRSRQSPVPEVFMTKGQRKNARRKRSRVLVAANRIPLPNVYLRIFFQQVLPSSSSELTMNFSVFMDNAKLFYCAPNCPVEVIDKVFDTCGDIKPSFKNACLNYMGKYCSHVSYVKWKHSPNGLPLLTGYFSFVPWTVGKVHPREAVEWLTERLTSEKMGVFRPTAVAMHPSATSVNLNRGTEAVSVDLDLGTGVASVNLNRGTEAPYVDLDQGTGASAGNRHIRPHPMQAHEDLKLKADAALEVREQHQAALATAVAKEREESKRKLLAAQKEHATKLLAAEQQAAHQQARVTQLSGQVKQLATASNKGMVIANFKQPVGLVQTLTQVGVTHSYVHPRMLEGRVYDVSRCVVIIDFEAVQNRIPLELGCIVLNDHYEVIGEYCRTCILATSQDSYAQGMVGMALPYVPKNGKGRAQQFAAAVGQVTASEKESVRASFIRFLELCLGGDYIKVNMFAKAKRCEVDCLNVLGFRGFCQTCAGHVSWTKCCSPVPIWQHQRTWK